MLAGWETWAGDGPLHLDFRGSLLTGARDQSSPMNPFSRGENRLGEEGHSRQVTSLMAAQTASSAGGSVRGGPLAASGNGEGSSFMAMVGGLTLDPVMPAFKTPAHKASTPEYLPWAVRITCRTR